MGQEGAGEPASSRPSFSSDIRHPFGSAFNSVSSRAMDADSSSPIALTSQSTKALGKSCPSMSCILTASSTWPLQGDRVPTPTLIGVLVVATGPILVSSIHQALTELKVSVVLHASSPSELVATLASIIKVQNFRHHAAMHNSCTASVCPVHVAGPCCILRRMHVNAL